MTEQPWTDEPLSRDILGAADLTNSNGRVIRYLLSNSSVARDGHTISTSGWSLDRYRQNPVMLWAHDNNMLPIGKMVEIGTVGDRLMGSFQYPEEDEYKFADTIYRLVRGGYLNAVSVGWIPIEWEYAKDRSRPGGIDFKRAELIEVSQVPVGALPDALVTARAAGIDTGPLYEWAEKVLAQGGDKILIPRGELEAMRRAAKMPTPKAADNATDQSEIDAVTKEKPAEDNLPFRERMVRNLTDSGWPAIVVDQIPGLDCELDGDAILRMLGQIVGRALDAARAPQTPPAPAEPPVVQIGTEAARIFVDALQRAGKMLSAENEAKLREADDHFTRGRDVLRSVYMPVEQPAAEDPAEYDELASARAEVARMRAEAA